jgi:hypothetical protein
LSQQINTAFTSRVGLNLRACSSPICKNSGLTIILVATLLASFQALSQETAPNPMALFRESVALLQASPALSVHIEKQFDVLLANSAKVQYSGAMDLTMRRKDGLHVDYGDDLSAREAWYDGAKFIIFDQLANVYVEAPAKGTVAEMLLSLEQRYGAKLPLAPLLRGTVADDVSAVVESSSYLGVHDVNGVPSHHILLRGAEIDLQLWIDADDKPLLRKMIATFNTIEGAPQQVLTFSEWDLDARISRNTFSVKLPDDAIKTDFIVREGR